MKNTMSMVVYVITFFAMFFCLSILGMCFGATYKQTIGSGNWFVMYSIFLGWWIALIPAHDTWELMNKKGL